MYGTTKTPNSKNKIEEENESWRHHSSRLQVVLKSCTEQNSMVLAKNNINITNTNTQTHKSIEWKPRDKLTSTWSINSQQSRKEYPMKKRESGDTGVAQSQKHLIVDSAQVMISAFTSLKPVSGTALTV